MATPQFRNFRALSGSVSLIVSLTLSVAGLSIISAVSASADTSITSLNHSSVAPLGPNDVLHINVEGQPDLSSDYTIDANGDITMVYAGKLHVGGMTPDGAQKVVSAALGKIYINPVVTVSLASMGGLSITVTGAVQRQGSTVARRDARLNDVIQQSVPVSDADLSKIQVTRGLPGQQHSVDSFNLTDFLGNGSMQQNPLLQDGDVIFVPNKAQITYSVSVVGEVLKPGRFDVQPGASVYDVIRNAGGLDDIADHSGIYVQPLGSLDRHSFNYDKALKTPEDPATNPLLNDGDKVVVPGVASAPAVSITGAVLKPGVYPIRQAMTLTDLIGISGGMEDHAKANDTTITRETATGGATVMKIKAGDPNVSANFQLQPGDNIVIPHGTVKPKMDPLSVLGAIVTFGGLLKF